ncbi:MAG: TRAFs-binding domain-containing protein [Pyrinomonadaceae bacterium]
MANYETSEIADAKKILRGQEIAAPDRLLKLAEALRRQDAFNYARQLFGRLRKSPLTEPELAKSKETDADVKRILGGRETRVVLAQKHALCTYKDWDIPADTRLERALEILGEVERLDQTHDPETLGLAGAIYKRKWELTGQKQHLEQSLSYYRRGYEQGPELDYGYTGINAAYILDQLAGVESAEVATERARQAEEIRRAIIDKLSPLAEKEIWLKETWWFTVTLAEAFFGLGQYEQADQWLKRAGALADEGLDDSKRVADWEFETTTRQLANLARLRAAREGAAAAADAEPKQSRAWQTLKEFLQIGDRDYSAALRSAFTGKVGLALSGGGFRASLFHIGVLAKLAEKDALRSVEVLSCVSGGSIIGAHYYLEVRKLLQEKADDEITREDYIAIVKRIEREFLEGVQRNLRVRVMAEVTTNLKTVFKKNYSHTERIGELFERELLARVDDGEGDRERFLSRLYVRPQGEAASFTPRKDNWRRAAKVPILILNATTLNTGHNWQFTAAWMGEPAASINTEVDGNLQLRRMFYEDAPEGYRDFRLGRAVAASACVPILFDPIVLEDLYPAMTVRLVDGGIHDNQGVAGLLEQGCAVLLVSDASGQMETLDEPKAGRLSVGTRSLDMLMARVREAQYADLDARRDAGQLRGLMYVHLKKDLDVEPLNWIGCQDPFDAEDESRPVERRGALTSYGVRKDVQERLAAIRTDLDAFADAEAYALMTSGYLMTEHQFDRCIEGFGRPKEERADWRFLALEEPMKTVRDATLMRLLEVAQSRSLKTLKIYNLLSPLRVVGLVTVFLLGAAVLALAVYEVYYSQNFYETALLTIIIAAMLVVPLLLFGTVTAFFMLLLVAAIKLRSHNKTIGQILVGLGLTVGGFVVARLQLSVMDWLYLRLGDIKDKVASPAGGGDSSARPEPALTVKILRERLIDPKNSSESIPKVIDRAATVDAVGKLFEATGYEVTRFPRSHALNPLQIELDLYAQHPCDRVFVIVRSGAESAEPVDWRTASNLASATWLLDEDGTDGTDAVAAAADNDAAGPGEPLPSPQALLVLVDAPAHESLKRFIDSGAIKLLQLNTEQIKWIAGRAASDAELHVEATRWLVDLLTAPAADGASVDSCSLAIGAAPSGEVKAGEARVDSSGSLAIGGPP